MNETLTFNPETHPQENGRFICSKEHPMPAVHSGMWQHPDAKSIDEDYGRGGGVADGDYEKYRCPYCDTSWWEELPN